MVTELAKEMNFVKKDVENEIEVKNTLENILCEGTE